MFLFENKSLNVSIDHPEFYYWSKLNTKDTINFMSQKIKLLKKNKTFNFQKPFHFYMSYLTHFKYELVNYNNSNRKYTELKNIILKLRPEKLSEKFNKLSIESNKYYSREYSNLVSSILSDLSWQIRSYHIYSALLKGFDYRKIEPNLSEFSALSIFNFRKENDYITYCKFSRINSKLEDLKKIKRI